MKRKSFLILSALMALWSCSNDDALEGVAIEGNEVIKVAIAAQLPPNSAVGTYATPLNAGSNNSGIDNVDPDLYALRYQLEIRDVTDGNKVVYKEMKVQDIAASPQKTDFTADLIKGKEYRFVLWADITLKSENGGQDDHFYKTSDATMGLSAIELDATKFTVNDEAKDAYFVSDLKTVSGAAIDLTLHRPLGKIRFISTDFKSLNDTDQAKVIDNSAAKYYSATAKVYTKFNAVTGDVDVNSILVQATKATPAVGKSVKNSDGTLTMFWDYTFAPKDVQTYLNFQVDYTLTEKIPRYFFDTKIVIERNKLTTVRSTLFTQNQAINVTIDDDFIDGLTPGDTKIHIGQNPYIS